MLCILEKINEEFDIRPLINDRELEKFVKTAFTKCDDDLSTQFPNRYFVSKECFEEAVGILEGDPVLGRFYKGHKHSFSTLEKEFQREPSFDLVIV